MKHLFESSLRARLLWLVALAFVPAFLLIIHTGLEQRDKEIEAARQTALQVARQVSASQNQLFAGAQQLLVALANMPEIQQRDAERCNRRLASILEHFRDAYLSITAFKADGDLFCAAPYPDKPFSIADRKHYRKALATKQAALGGYVISRLLGQPSIYLSQPVLNQSGEVDALVNIGMDLGWLDKLMEGARLPKGSVLTVFDAKGITLARHPGPATWLGKPVPEQAIIDRLKHSDGAGTIQLTGPDQVARLYAFLPLSVPDAEAYVAVGIPLQAAYAPAKTTLMRNLAALAAVSLFAFAATWFGSRWFVTRHVDGLIQATRRLRSGDLAARADLAGGAKELTELGRTFDDMAAALETQEAERAREARRLADSEARFRAIIDASPVPIALHDDGQNILYLNDAFQQTFGYGPEEIPCLAEWWPRAYPDPAYREQVATEWSARMDTARRQGSAFEPMEVQIHAKDGTLRSVLATATNLGEAWPSVHLTVLYDITARKQAEQERLRNARLLDSIVEHIPSMIFLKRADDLRFVLFNQAGERITGHRREDLLGKNDHDFFPKEQADFFTAKDRETLASGQGLDIPEETIDTPSGPRLLHTRKLALRNDRGEAEYLLGISEDITERKRAEVDLQRFKTTLDLTQDCVFMFDPVTLKFSYFNQGAMQQVGYRAEELMQMSPVDIKPDYDEAQFRALIAPMLEGNSSSISFETRHRHRDGHDIAVEIFLQYLAPTGEPPRFVALVRDITERKRNEAALRDSEQKHRQLFETMLQGVVYQDRQGQILSANPAAERILGLSLDQMQGRSSLDPRWRAIHEDGSDFPGDTHPAMQALRSRQPVPNAVMGIFHPKDNAYRWILVSATPQFRADEPEPYQVYTTFTDITVHKQAEDRIATLNRELELRVVERTAELEAANRELQAFSYSVSHDLRAPLRGIDGFSKALLEDYGDELDATARDYLGRVRAGVQRMGMLIDDLLSLSRVTRATMLPTQVDLSGLAHEVINHLRAVHPDRQVEVVIRPDLVAVGDPGLLRVSLENLLGNAWKYTGKQPAARIEFGRKEDPSETVFFVRDNGAGFDMRYADKLFGAFQRLHPPAEFEGTGIGLATVQRIIHRHGGRIWAESAPDQGAAFYFTLARVDADQTELA